MTQTRKYQPEIWQKNGRSSFLYAQEIEIPAFSCKDSKNGVTKLQTVQTNHLHKKFYGTV